MVWAGHECPCVQWRRDRAKDKMLQIHRIVLLYGAPVCADLLLHTRLQLKCLSLNVHS